MARENTQKNLILRHLKDFKTISSFEAFIEYGITQLPARIMELKAEGYEFADEWVHKENRYGEPIKFKKWRIVKRDLFDT